MSNSFCPKCENRFYSHDLRLLKCPDCKVWLEWDKDYLVDQQNKSGLKTNNSSFSSEESRDTLTNGDSESENANEILDSLLKAQVRTIYAIRSLALFLFTFLTSFCMGGLAITAGSIMKLSCDYSCGSADFMSVLGYIVIVVGFIVALIAGVSQLSLSNPSRR